jgi:hypothetical protein
LAKLGFLEDPLKEGSEVGSRGRISEALKIELPLESFKGGVREEIGPERFGNHGKPVEDGEVVGGEFVVVGDEIRGGLGGEVEVGGEEDGCCIRVVLGLEEEREEPFVSRQVVEATVRLGGR